MVFGESEVLEGGMVQPEQNFFDQFRVMSHFVLFLLLTLFMNLIVLHFEECLSVVVRSCNESFITSGTANLIGNELPKRCPKVSITQAKYWNFIKLKPKFVKCSTSKGSVEDSRGAHQKKSNCGSFYICMTFN